MRIFLSVVEYKYFYIICLKKGAGRRDHFRRRPVPGRAEQRGGGGGQIHAFRGNGGFHCAGSGLSGPASRPPPPRPVPGGERGPPRFFANLFDPLALHLGGYPHVSLRDLPVQWTVVAIATGGGDRGGGNPRPGQNVTQKFLSGTPHPAPSRGRGHAKRARKFCRWTCNSPSRSSRPAHEAPTLPATVRSRKRAERMRNTESHRFITVKSGRYPPSKVMIIENRCAAGRRATDGFSGAGTTTNGYFARNGRR